MHCIFNKIWHISVIPIWKLFWSLRRQLEALVYFCCQNERELLLALRRQRTGMLLSTLLCAEQTHYKQMYHYFKKVASTHPYLSWRDRGKEAFIEKQVCTPMWTNMEQKSESLSTQDFNTRWRLYFLLISFSARITVGRKDPAFTTIS